MKITIKDNAKRALSLVLSLVMAFSVMMPAFAVEQTGVEVYKINVYVDSMKA